MEQFKASDIFTYKGHTIQSKGLLGRVVDDAVCFNKLKDAKFYIDLRVDEKSRENPDTTVAK